MYYMYITVYTDPGEYVDIYTAYMQHEGSLNLWPTYPGYSFTIVISHIRYCYPGDYFGREPATGGSVGLSSYARHIGQTVGSFIIYLQL